MTHTPLFGSWVRERRRALGLTQAALARRVGCAESMLRKVETGARRPSHQMAALLADALQVPEAEHPMFVAAARADTGAFPAPAAQALPRTNIPPAPTSLIGRADEGADLESLLRHPDARLLTLVGPAGVGKTRLALDVAPRCADRFPDGVWLVKLAPVLAPELVAAAIARALGVGERGGQPLEAALKEHLRDRAALLVLDNFEHLLPAASLVAELLAASLGLVVLATSRTPLRLRAERQVQLAPLALPDSVALFVARAQAAAHSFALREENAAQVEAICTHLEGLPLAIELAAARSAVFAPAELLAKIERRLAALTHGPRDAPERQRTLRAALDWGHALLEPRERDLFAILGTFVGGCSLEAVTAIWGFGGATANDALDTLAALVDHSLVQRAESGEGETRFTLLETIREYAGERLRESGQERAVTARHARYFLALAERAAAELHGPNGIAWLARLDREQPNMEAALAFFRAGGDGEGAGLRLAGALWPFWHARSYLHNGRARLRQLLEQNGNGPHRQWRMRAVLGAGWLAYYQDDYTEAAITATRCLRLAEEAGDGAAQSEALNLLGFCVAAQGERMPAIDRLEDSVCRARASGDALALCHSLLNLGWLHSDCCEVDLARRRFAEALALARQIASPLLLPQALNALGELARLRGEHSAARDAYRESLACYDALGDRRGVAAVEHNLGYVARHLGDVAEADAHFHRSLVLYEAIGDAAGVAAAVAGIAGVADLRGEHKRAAWLFGAARALRTRTGAPVVPPDLHDLDAAIATARANLPPVAWEVAWADGAAAPFEAVMARV